MRQVLFFCIRGNNGIRAMYVNLLLFKIFLKLNSRVPNFILPRLKSYCETNFLKFCMFKIL